MTKHIKPKLTLDMPARYQIILPGLVEEKWFLDYQLDGFSSTTDREKNHYTYLTITADQAALQGLLRYLYTLRLPLLAVKWLGLSPNDQLADQKEISR